MKNGLRPSLRVEPVHVCLPKLTKKSPRCAQLLWCELYVMKDLRTKRIDNHRQRQMEL